MAITPSNGKTLLITGINGYIASTLGLLLLTKGYNLRGTSRSAKSSAPLLTGPYKEYASRVQLFEVPDMTAPGAFDEAVVGEHLQDHLWISRH
jgi:GDP-D-mannose dehydratase